MLDFLKSAALVVLLSLTIALVLTGFTLYQDKQKCDATGGTYTITATVANCHY
jgi:Ni,Fe-hydrogenase I cytochrome b subunit